jgi:tetratricopeptide (TPR) repeat protein
VREHIKQKEYTRGEWALLPSWCVDSQDGPFGSPEGPTAMNRSPRAPQWVAAMGTDFWHMHHYCRGLRDVQRLKHADLSARERLLLQERAVDEFEYIERNAKSTMPLMPEVLLRKGEVLLQAGKLPEASFAFERSRALKPDYWPAYDRWIDVLRGLKQYSQALALTQEGLAHAPDQPVLKAHLAELKGISASAPGAGPKTNAKPATQAAAGSR